MRTLSALVLAAWLVGAIAQETTPFRLVFSRAEVGSVLKSVSLRTGARIVYAAPAGGPAEPGAAGGRQVTLDVSVSSVEEAIRAVVASAGLTFRKVGSIYIVADEKDMKSALAPYAVQARFAVSKLTADEAAKFLEAAIPTLSARAAGSSVMVSAIPEDMMLAQRMLKEREGQLEEAEFVSEVILVKNTSSDQLAKMLTTLFPELKATPSSLTTAPGGAIALSGPKDIVERAKEVADEVDIPISVPVPDISYRVYEVKYATAPVLKTFVEETFAGVKAFVGPESYTPPQPSFRPLTGATLGTSTGGSGSGGSGISAGGGAQGGAQGAEGGTGGVAGGTVQPFQRAKEGDRARHLILQGPSALVDAVMAMLVQVDVKPVQVQVEVKVVDVSPEKLIESGFDYTWRPFTWVETPAGTGFSGSLPPTGTIDIEATGLPTKQGLGAMSRIPWRWDMILRGLITKRDAKLLASPNVVVTDNDDASIFIGDTLRVQIAQANGLGGTTIQVVEFPVGIVLLLRPRVNTEGNVTLRVHPVVSAITAIGDNDLPQTSTREAETTVVVKDGETIVIGGLIREDMIKTVREIPFLADLPILGELFKSRTSQNRRSDVLIFITTRIVKDGQPPAEPGKIGKDGVEKTVKSGG